MKYNKLNYVISKVTTMWNCQQIYKPNPNLEVSKSKKSNIQPILKHLDELRVKFLLFDIL